MKLNKFIQSQRENAWGNYHSYYTPIFPLRKTPPFPIKTCAFPLKHKKNLQHKRVFPPKSMIDVVGKWKEAMAIGFSPQMAFNGMKTTNGINHEWHAWMDSEWGLPAERERVDDEKQRPFSLGARFRPLWLSRPRVNDRELLDFRLLLCLHYGSKLYEI